LAFLEREVVGIQGSDLAAVVARLVGVLVVHIIWYTNFCKDARMDTHVLGTFFSDRTQLVGETVSYSSLTDLDGKGWCKILASQHAEDVDVPHAVPVSLANVQL
jgi:hypothetical protein